MVVVKYLFYHDEKMVGLIFVLAVNKRRRRRHYPPVRDLGFGLSLALS
jgi:hypothetical protein